MLSEAVNITPSKTVVKSKAPVTSKSPAGIPLAASIVTTPAASESVMFVPATIETVSVVASEPLKLRLIFAPLATAAKS